MPQVEHELLTGAPEFIPVISEVRFARSLVFCVKFCRSLFVLLFLFFWALSYLSFFDLRILITPLVSSNSSSNDLWQDQAHNLHVKSWNEESILMISIYHICNVSQEKTYFSAIWNYLCARAAVGSKANRKSFWRSSIDQFFACSIQIVRSY